MRLSIDSGGSIPGIVTEGYMGQTITGLVWSAISVTHNPLSLSILAKYPAFRAMQDTSLTNCVSALCMSHNSETCFVDGTGTEGAQDRSKNKFLSNFFIKLLFFNKNTYICISKNDKKLIVL